METCNPTVATGEPPLSQGSEELLPAALPIHEAIFNSVTVAIGDASCDKQAGKGETVLKTKIKVSLKLSKRGLSRNGYINSCLQLTLILEIASFLLLHPDLEAWTVENRGWYNAAMAVMAASTVLMVSWEGLKQKVPLPYIIGVGLFDIVEGLVIGTFPYSFPEPTSILFGIVITGTITMGMKLCSIQTKWDLTLLRGLRTVAGIDLWIFRMFISPFPFQGQFSCLDLMCVSQGAVLISVYLVYNILKRDDDAE